MAEFINSIRHLKPMIALEWPSGCIYWNFDRVQRFLHRFNLEMIKFDGCMLGVVNKEGIPMKKPWTIATNCSEVMKFFSNLKCLGEHTHAQGRGEDLKNTESYTYEFTDRIHKSFAAAVRYSSRQSSARSPAVVAVMANVKMNTEFDLSGSMESARSAEVFPCDFDGEVMEAVVMDDPRGDNIRGWEQLASKIATFATVADSVNEAAMVVDMVSGANPLQVAIEKLEEISPADHSLLDGMNGLKIRGVKCPGEPMATYIFAGDSSMALVDFPKEADQTHSRRNAGEYVKQDASQLIGVPRSHVRHGMRWGRGLPEILDAVDADSRPTVVVISYAGNDIYGQFVDCEYIENERACQSQARRDAMEALLNQRIPDPGSLCRSGKAGQLEQATGDSLRCRLDASAA